MRRVSRYSLCIISLLLFSGITLQASENIANKQESGTDFTTISTATKQKMYLLNKTNILSTNNLAASTIETQDAGSTVYVLNIDTDICKVLTQSGKIGYVPFDSLTSQGEYIFTSESKTIYANTDTDLRAVPFQSGKVVKTITKNTELQLVGSNSLQYQKVKLDNTIYYMDVSNISDEKISETKTSVTQENENVSYTTENVSWTGASLNQFNGSIIGPSGKETYYNLDMSGVVSIMRGTGNTDEYWVRSDGVKMLGNYVMVAANLSIRPRGSLVATSLGTGIVCDTGGFALNNTTQLDIATNW